MRILIGVDASPAAATACRFVAGRSWPIGTRIVLLGAIDRPVGWTGLPDVAAETDDADRARLLATLEGHAADLDRPGLAVEVSVEQGDPARLLVERAAEWVTDLIVVGNRGHGPLASAVLGSVSAHLVDHAGCPVLVVRSPTASRMLLATDGTRSCRSIPRVLAGWGNAFRGLPVEVLSVVTERDGQAIDAEHVLHEEIARNVADEMTELGWQATALTRRGEPSREIVEAGRDRGADLIVTGSRGIGTLQRLIGGSVAHDVLLHTRSSVLVVRGQVPARQLAAAPALGTLGVV